MVSGFVGITDLWKSIYRNKRKRYVFMSVGLVSIITFISNFLEKQTIDIDNKDNFYLGYNIKK